MVNPDAGHLGCKVGFSFLATGLAAAIGGWFLYADSRVSTRCIHLCLVIVINEISLGYRFR